MIFELFDEDTAGVRPGVLAEPRPQERVQRHTIEHIVDLVRVAPMVQILDALVPQTLEQLPGVLQFFDTLTTVPEQVLEVPKILPEDVPMRAVLPDTQLAEQLVEVPTIVSYSWLQLRLEQNVDIPVPGRGGRSSGLQGFLPGQGSTALLSSEERISDRTVEQIVDISGGGLQDFRPGLRSSSSSHFPAGVPEALDEPGQGFFRTFHQNQKVRSRVRTRVRGLPASVSPSTPAPQHRVRLLQWVMILSDQWPFFWNKDTGEKRRATNLAGGGEMATMSTLATTDGGDLVLGLGGGGAARAREPPVSLGGSWKNSLFLHCRVVALCALGNLDFAFAFISFSPCPVFGCCLWSTAYGFSGTLALLGSTVDTCSTGGFGQIPVFSTLR